MLSGELRGLRGGGGGCALPHRGGAVRGRRVPGVCRRGGAGPHPGVHCGGSQQEANSQQGDRGLEEKDTGKEDRSCE